MTILPYDEGTVFLVPLRTGGYARGIVARTSNEGKILLGYFFGPCLKSPNEKSLDGLDPTNSILCIRFGDLGLINGEWIICGRIPNWNRNKWPMPDFARNDPLSKKTWLVRYSDNDPNLIEKEIPTNFDLKLAKDLLAGYGAVEIKLTQLLNDTD